MNYQNKYSCTLRIENPLGFHVRPVQRFAELAQAFNADIAVEIDGRKASGKSVMGLMSLGGRCGSIMKIKTNGEDARQALDVIRYLVGEDFFVEDNIGPGERPRRHIERLKRFVSCFDSDIKVFLDGKEINTATPQVFERLEFCPTADINFEVNGNDAEQALRVLQKLVNYRFYIEDAMSATSD